MDFWRKQTWDLVGRSWIWFTLSGVLFLLGMAAWIGMGLNLGIDFTGGSLLQYQFPGKIAEGSAAEGEAVGKIRDAADFDFHWHVVPPASHVAGRGTTAQ